MRRLLVSFVALSFALAGVVRAESVQKSGSTHTTSSHASTTKTSTPKATSHPSGTKKSSTTSAKTHAASHTAPKATKAAASTKASKPATSTATHHNSNYCETCARDSHGRILRGDTAKDAFKAQTGYPKGRPGYVIDHVVPLACGGADNTSNMQWQTVAAAKAKDNVERRGCTK